MADSTLNYFVGTGTAAEMAAFTPAPPTPANAPPAQGYVFFNTDDSTLYAWDGANFVPAVPGGGGGDVFVQQVNTQTGAVATGTTTIPDDDTIPQNTEGNEYMTLAVTPTDAANKLKIEVVFNGGNSNNNVWTTVALFQDSTANALAVGRTFNAVATAFSTVSFSHYMTAGTTSATTFKVRAGSESAGTITFNGQSGARKMGGVFASSITITEIVP